MAIDIMQPIRLSIDLESGLVQTPLRMHLMKGDKKANRVIVALTENKKEADLTGVIVTGSFIRPSDSAEIPLVGTTAGNHAIVVLNDACYEQEGYCKINVSLTMGDTTRTIVSLTGNVLSKGSGAYVDVSGVIPSIDDIIAQYAEMKRVTKATQEAADAATAAASRAPYVNPDSKNWMVWDAATGMYVDSGVTAQGEPGPQGPPGQNGTGSGTVTGIKVDEQTYQPDSSGVVTLPKMGGGDASIDDTEPSADKTYSSQKVEEIASQLSQQIEELDAEAVGALPAGGTAEDASKLGGKVPSAYVQTANVLDTLEEVAANTASGMVAGAKAVKAMSGMNTLNYSGIVVLDKILDASGKTYTCPKNGIVKIGAISIGNTNLDIVITHSGLEERVLLITPGSGAVPFRFEFQVNAGEVLTMKTYNGVDQLYNCFFIPYVN